MSLYFWKNDDKKLFNWVWKTFFFLWQFILLHSHMVCYFIPQIRHPLNENYCWVGKTKLFQFCNYIEHGFLFDEFWFVKYKNNKRIKSCFLCSIMLQYVLIFERLFTRKRNEKWKKGMGIRLCYNPLNEKFIPLVPISCTSKQ